MPIDPNLRRMLELFFCYDRKRVRELGDEKRLLAHYTTAETAMKIIRGRSMWLRNAAVMNDYSEIDYGRAVMEPVLKGPLGDRFRAALEGVGEGLAQLVTERHEMHRSHVREAVFTASLSEHDRTDVYGRLSMWRAYGGPVSGVALLFKGEVADIEVEPSLECSVSPVLYGGPNEFHEEFAETIKLIEDNRDFLRAFDPTIIVNAATTVLQFSMFSIKHPGFGEEREWRVIHRPYEFASAYIKPETVTLGGIPQTVYELPFHNPAKGELFNIPQLNLNDILHGVMLGPCAYPETVIRALVDEMTAAGIENAKGRIFVSDIPLRQQW